MASNTRGKLKENFEGIHRNLDWVKHHCQKSIDIIDSKHPSLTKAVKALAESVDTLDECAQGIYSTL
ncbi:unnamed protein product [marine sediment metagenome]|uniref:Uncharacterized protein n=1 Tax=marine sediment metagenome TaxID=412755 RepID=X1CJL3_9ZZZZ